MEYYIQEQKFADETSKTAWSKARDDAERICESIGFRGISVCPDLGDRVNVGKLDKVKMNFQMKKIWRECLSVLQPGDTLLIQLPVIHNCLFLSGVLKELKKRNVHIIGLIHDLELLRMSIDQNMGFSSRMRIQIEEKGALQNCNRIIVHNEKMKNFLIQQKIESERMVSLEIFDYLMEPEICQVVESRPIPEEYDRLIVAGNLSPNKAGYVYQVPENVDVNLYGVLYQPGERKNHHYQGAFPPGELPAKLEGGFGLIWDGPSAESCVGTYGEYLRYNNPHKTSLYLASGIPVVIWEKAALADFVLRENVGIVANSISDAEQRVAAISNEAYRVMYRNAQAIGKKLREGDYLKRAIENSRAGWM